jgi:hypothetical protein
MKYLSQILFFSVLILGCSKEDVLPENPYDSVDYGNDNVTQDTLDINGITSIHKDILQPKCSTPGCHDGSFEPDFRTVMSSYATLVYHPILKNSIDSLYKYRVVPYDTNSSVLQKRLNLQTFANTNDRMPQDNIGFGLPQDDLDRISAWIENGAKDFQGNVAVLPNTEPLLQYFWMIDGTGYPVVPQPYVVFSNISNRIDQTGHLPIVLDTGLTCYIIPSISDDSTSLGDMTKVTLEMSYIKDDFSSPFKTLPASFTSGTYESWNNLFEIDNTYLTDTIIYMRYVMNDGDHVTDASFPRSDSPEWYKTFWSIYISKGSHQ